jgi:amidohydrolase
VSAIPTETFKQQASAAVDTNSDHLVAISHEIHAHPELGFEEELASHWCADELARVGFDVVFGVGGLDTAFSASVGSGVPVIGICCEYDALPQVGHACGHNVIAAAGVGAGLALAEIADDLGVTVRVLGTPAEEGGGGKILMLDAGVFDGLGAAMMVHPAPSELVQMPVRAVSHLITRFYGKEAHASGFPELGINAADALTISQVAIGLLRQHARRDDQVHGIVTNGGAAPNIIPGFTEAAYYVRSRSLDGLKEWEPRVRACFEAGALATGSTVEFLRGGPTYSEFRTDEAIAERYRLNALAVGREFAADLSRALVASTDMANVSLALPAIHPTLDIGAKGAVNHQPEFAAYCATPTADRAVIEGAKAMAWTVIDLATDDAERARLSASSYRRIPNGWSD